MSRLKQALPLIGTGAAFGLAFFGAEELLHMLLGQPHLRASQILQLLPFYAGIPALFGAALGAVGFKGVAGALWLCAGIAVAMLAGPGAAAWGAPGLLAALILPPLAVILTLFVTREMSDGVRWAAVPAALVWLVFATVLNGSSVQLLSIQGALVNLGLLVISGALVGAVGKALGDRNPKMGVMALLLAAVLWPIRMLVASPTSRNLPPKAKTEQPAILLVVVDGLRADHVGHLSGAKESDTPRLDALAERSFSYSAQASAPADLPAMASILTGLYPSVHEAGGARAVLTSNHRTMAEYAQDAEYVTGAVLARERYGPGSGLEQGFGYYELFTGLGHRPSLLATLDLLHLPLLSARHYAGAERITDRALEFLERQPEQGWLLMVEYADLLGPSENTYEQDLHGLDQQLSRLLSAAPKDAWVFIVGVHGLELGADGGRSVGASLSQAELSVPLIVYRPRNNHPASVLRVVQTTDILPTMLHITKQKVLVGTDGNVLFEVFQRSPPEQLQAAVSERPDGSQRCAVAEGWKVVWSAEPESLALYNLVLDPQELQDLLDEEPARAAALAQSLPGVSWPEPQTPPETPPEPQDPAE